MRASCTIVQILFINCSRLQYHIIEHFPFTYLDISEIKNDEIIPMPCCQNLGEIHLKKCIFREEKISRNFTYFGQMHIKKCKRVVFIQSIYIKIVWFSKYTSRKISKKPFIFIMVHDIFFCTIFPFLAQYFNSIL